MGVCEFIAGSVRDCRDLCNVSGGECSILARLSERHRSISKCQSHVCLAVTTGRVSGSPWLRSSTSRRFPTVEIQAHARHSTDYGHVSCGAKGPFQIRPASFRLPFGIRPFVGRDLSAREVCVVAARQHNVRTLLGLDVADNEGWPSFGRRRRQMSHR